MFLACVVKATKPSATRYPPMARARFCNAFGLECLDALERKWTGEPVKTGALLIRERPCHQLERPKWAPQKPPSSREKYKGKRR